MLSGAACNGVVCTRLRISREHRAPGRSPRYRAPSLPVLIVRWSHRGMRRAARPRTCALCRLVISRGVGHRPEPGKALPSPSGMNHSIRLVPHRFRTEARPAFQTTGPGVVPIVAAVRRLAARKMKPARKQLRAGLFDVKLLFLNKSRQRHITRRPFPRMPGQKRAQFCLFLVRKDACASNGRFSHSGVVQGMSVLVGRHSQILLHGCIQINHSANLALWRCISAARTSFGQFFAFEALCCTNPKWIHLVNPAR